MIAAPMSFYSPTNLNARAQKSFAGCDDRHCDFALQETGEHKPLIELAATT